MLIDAHVLVYNTRMLKAADVPTTHADLLKPQWTNKFVMVSKAYEWFLKILKLQGEAKGMEFFKQLAAQKPGFRIGSSQIADLVAAGEQPIGINTYSTNIEDLKAKGAPVEWVRARSGGGDTAPGGGKRAAPHPNAAKLFVDFVLLKEGMLILRSFDEYQPARCRAMVPRLTKGIKFYPSEPELAEEFDKYARTFQNIFDVR